MKKPLLLLLALAAMGPPSMASSLYLTTDVPTPLGPATWVPSQVVRYDTGTYGLALGTLPAGAVVDALHRRETGEWLLSFEAPTEIAGVVYDPRDVVRETSPGVYANYFCGGSLGAFAIPAGSNVDAIFQPNGTGSIGPLLVSFDVPTTIVGTTYDPADIVQWNRGGPGPSCTNWFFIGLVFDASATVPPIPISTNLVAVDERGGDLILSFDVPTTLGAITYLPGQLVAWDGAGFSLFESLVGWPPNRGSFVNALAFLPAPGEARGLLVSGKAGVAPVVITLSWTASCTPGGVEDYGIYEGTLGTWYDHTLVDCTDDGGDLTESVTTAAGNHYYLVVPHNTNDEGSYGRRSGAIERPPGSAGCVPTQEIPPICP